MAASAPPAGLSRFFSVPEGSKADSPKPGRVNPVHEASGPGCPELSSRSLEEVLETPGVGELFQDLPGASGDCPPAGGFFSIFTVRKKEKKWFQSHTKS